MAACKNCLHGDVCFTVLDSMQCQHFKDRSRFVKLPCRVGDEAYTVLSDEGINEYTVFSIAIMIADGHFYLNINLKNKRGAIMCDFHPSDIGKILFFTKLEAEQALKKRDEND